MRPAPPARLRSAALAACFVLVASLSTALGSAALAQTTPKYDIIDELVDAFQTKSGQKFTKQFTVGEELIFADPAGDYIHPTGQKPGFTPEYLDIQGITKTGKIMPGTDVDEFLRFFGDSKVDGPWCRPSGFGSNPDIKSVCSPSAGGPTFDGGALGVGGTTVETIPLEAPAAGQCELGFWSLNPAGGPPSAGSASLPQDPGKGMNQGYLVFWNGAGSMELTHVETGAGGQFGVAPTNARAAIYENQFAFLVPLEEIGQITRANYHTFCTENLATRLDPNVGGGDRLGPIDVDLASLATLIFTGIPPPSPTPTVAPTSAGPTAAETPGAVPTAEKSSLPFISLIVIGLILFLIGLFLLLRLLRQPGKPPPEEEHYTPTQPMVGEPTAGEDVPTEPTGEEMPPVPVVPKTETRDICDWALDFVDGKKGKVRLRFPKGHECCTYVVRVGTSTQKDEAAVQGRQEPDMVGGTAADPKGRLRIPYLDLKRSGLDMKMQAAVRSGPAGNLDWMHGYGEPEMSQDLQVEPYHQTKAHEEPPDVIAHFVFAETTRVNATLSSDCPGHQNAFDLVADGFLAAGSRVLVNADQECTNKTPGECPVEFSADGGGALAVVGPINYWARHVIGSSPDEVERNVKEPIPEQQFQDPKPPEVSGTLHQPHDHQERAHYTGKAQAGDGTTQNGDAITFDVFNSGVLDVGIIVPMAVWPATGRVTSSLQTACDHGIALAGKMTRTTCANAPCCGKRRCICKPAFSLEFDEGKAVLTVEGKKHEIERQHLRPKVGFEHVWVLK